MEMVKLLYHLDSTLLGILHLIYSYQIVQSLWVIKMARGGETCKLMHRPGGTSSNQVGTTLSGGRNFVPPD